MGKRASAAEKAAARAGANVPTAGEFSEFFDRLHEINDRMEEDNATHRGDMNSVYEDAAKELDMPKEVVAALYKNERKERKAAKKFAKADTRTRDGFAKASQAFLAVDPESPMGKWAARMAVAAGTAAPKPDAAEGTEEEGDD